MSLTGVASTVHAILVAGVLQHTEPPCSPLNISLVLIIWHEIRSESELHAHKMLESLPVISRDQMQIKATEALACPAPTDARNAMVSTDLLQDQSLEPRCFWIPKVVTVLIPFFPFKKNLK